MKVCFLAVTLLSAVARTGTCQPVITAQPQNQTNVAGTTATFVVDATNSLPIFYQWRFNAGLFNETNLTDSTNTMLVLTNVQPGNAGPYAVVLTNADGVLTSAVATLTVLVPPTIATLAANPTNQSVSLGAKVTFAFRASGTSPLYYQWRFSQTELSGRTTTSLVLTNVQTTNAGNYTLVVTNVAGSVTSQVAHLDVDPTFTKITTGFIVTNVGYNVSCAWGDYDNDGFIDLIVTSVSESAPTAQKNLLFHNNRDGTFTGITNTVITAEGRDWRGCAWADYDNDGNLDLFIASTDAAGFPSQNELFRNNGDGTFTKMTPSAVGGIASLAAGGSEGGLWADYDNDGFLDIYMPRYGPDWLFHNNGDATFSRITNSIPPDNQDNYGSAWGDYNNDGRPDLFLAIKSDPPTNLLYLNLGDGTFERISSGTIATNSAHSFGCAWGDYNNDGYLDLFVSNGGYVASETNFLYRNNTDGTFTRMTSSLIGTLASDRGNFNASSWGDYDNDGFIDLFITTYDGGVNLSANFLYHNNGDGSFSRVLSGSLVNDKTFSGGCGWGDYDNDGFLDLFVVHNGGSVPGTNLLYRNNGNSNAWIKFKLVGTLSNRSAIGAKVRVRATIRGQSMWQMREIGTGGRGNPLEAHFGLGDVTNIDLVRIEWPSGIVQTLTNVAPKQSLTVVEHQQPGASTRPSFTSESRSTNGMVDLSVSGDTNLLYVFEASTNLVNWTKVGVRSNATGPINFTDTKAGNYVRRFYRASVP